MEEGNPGQFQKTVNCRMPFLDGILREGSFGDGAGATALLVAASALLLRLYLSRDLSEV